MDNASDQMPPDTNLRDAISQLGAQLRRTRGGKAQIPVVVGDTEPALVELAELINNILDDARSNVGRLEDANRDLDSMVRQRTAELEHAKTVAELGSTAKSKFLAQMSHELRTPLNSIIGFAQLLLDSNKEILSDRQSKQVKYILRGGRHLLGLINDVLDLSKIESGKLDLQIEPVDTQTVIAESLQIISPLFETYGVHFENRIKPGFEMPGVMGDSLRIKQCLINLLNNACKYNKPDGRVWIDAHIFKNDRLRLIVGDTGLGIPERKQHELFRPFSRLGREESEIEGSGVGLVLTRLLIHAMDGVLDFDSAEDEGSLFWFDLPVSALPGATRNDPDMTPVMLERRSQGVILYVEDIASNVLLMEDMLSEYTDVQVLTAASAEDGINLAQEQLPDLIVMDLNLSGMNGIDATRYLRSVASTKNIPIFALTGDVQENTRARCEEAGVDKFFAKPFVVNEFIDAICVALDQRLGKFL